MFRSTGLTPAVSPTEKKTRPARWALALFMALVALLFAPLQAQAGGVTFTATAGSYYDGYGLGSDGNIYAWGGNTSGQLGNGGSVFGSPAPVPVDASALPAGALPFKAVAAGFYSGYGLGSDNNIYAWGRGDYGQLGNNTNINSPLPVQVIRPAGVTFTAVASGLNSFSGYGLGLDGNIYAWGRGDSGQLGNGLTNNSLTPVQVSMPASAPAGFMFKAVAVGGSSAYGLGSDDNIYAWGTNAYGALGNNSPFDSSVPVQVSMPAGVPAGFKFTAVAAAGYSAYALGSDGNIYAWGSNNTGQLGNGSTANSSVPVPVNTSNLPAGVTFTAVAAGYGVGSDGNLYAWGNNDYGQLGNDSTIQSLVPVQVNMPAGVPDGFTFTAASAGMSFGYGLGSDGNIYAWGRGDSGQLGYNTSITQSLVPLRVYMANWGISLTVPGIVSGTYTFGAETYGYATSPSETVTVTNAGNQDTGLLAVSLSGANPDKFQLSTAILPSLTTTVGSNSTVFTLLPVGSLAAGTYTVTVTVGAAAGNTNPIEPQTFDVSFTVNPAIPAPADFSFTPSSATYDGGAHPVTVSPLASVTGMGAITAVYYNGSTAEPTAAGTYEITIDVDDGANYAAATGLSLGNFTIDAATPVAADFSFTPASATYNGSAQPVTVSPAAGVTGIGTVTVYYAGSTTAPTNAGTYAITVDVAAGANYAATTNLPLGNFTITPATPVAANFSFTPASATYNGSAQPVTVSTVAGITGMGAVTVLYNGSATVPANAGTYAITINVAAGTNYVAATALPLGNFTINPATPVAANFSLTPASATYNGSAHSVTVSTAAGITGMGAVTVLYNGSATAPANAGTYAITINVAAGANYAAATALPLGNLTINPATPVAANFSFTPASATYNGSAQPVSVSPVASITGMGAVTVLYNGSATVPTNAGTYAITINVAAGTNYGTATALPLGNFTITPATPTAANFSFTPASATYNGSAQPVTVSPVAGITGMGAVTVLYNGSATVPTNAGTYAITINVAAGTNYVAAAGLALGNFTINPATPVAANFSFTPASATYNGSAHGVTVSTAAGITGMGAVTVLYNGSATVPANAGTYAITINVATGANYAAATALPLGNFTINPATPVAANFSFTPTNIPYDGSAHGVTVSPVAGITGMGTVTAVLYNGSATAPTNAGAYTITINVAAGTNYTAATALPLGTFTIGSVAPVAADFTFTPASATYNGSAQPVSVSTVGSISGMGTVTATLYNGSATVPTNAGTYAITINVAAGASYTAASGLALGSYTINPASQTITFGTAPAVHVTGTGTVSASTTATPAASHAITYSTTSTDCTVDASTGVVTGIHAGTGNCVITATQAGDANYSSASNTQTLSIAQDPTPTVALSATPNPATVGASVTITATVAGDPPTGTVTFCDGATTTDATCTGGTVLCSAVPLVPATLNSTASCTHTFSSAGAQTITALYSGDADFAQAETALALSLNVVALNSGGDAVAIPTLSQWALALLALLLAGGAAAHSRRARRGS